MLLALGVVAHRQVGYWSESLTMWEHATAVVPNHWEAEDNIGVALLRRGRPEAEALPHFIRAAQMNPNDAGSNLHVAIYEMQRGNVPEAIAHYKGPAHAGAAASRGGSLPEPGTGLHADRRPVQSAAVLRSGGQSADAALGRLRASVVWRKASVCA